MALARFIAVMAVALVARQLRPWDLSPNISLFLGVFIGLVFIVFEARLEKVTLRRLIGASVGAIVGILGARMIADLLTASLAVRGNTVSFIQISLLMLMGYIGLVLGANKGDLLNLSAMGGLFGGERSTRKSYKLLDTSVIIDGRIADVAETGFLDGVLVIPQFVLRELQLVADSSDSLKRNRGRRGLEVLQRIQKISGNFQVIIVEDDFPHIREVDLKLIELGKQYEARIMTNDFNLNKVAQVRGVGVLNINELANSLKPVVLPGETMRVFILKEGKEYNQGVAYLDDGTMVVVDNARRMISKNVDVLVTSVLQTTVGKMIFGKYNDGSNDRTRAEAVSQ
ncbi:MAG: TRAM domain-containing protein [Acidobacteria bacterium]|nr:TRAM domain-containing protein [Acidobacteriota bacterium]